MVSCKINIYKLEFFLIVNKNVLDKKGRKDFIYNCYKKIDIIRNLQDFYDCIFKIIEIDKGNDILLMDR